MDVKKQGALYSVSTVVFMFAQWVISVALVRLGGFEDAGIFSLAMSIANIFGAVATYGIRKSQVADIDQQYTQKQYLAARIVTVFLSFAACTVYLALFGRYTRREGTAIILYLVYVNVNAFSDVLYGALQAKNKLYVNGVSFLVKGFLCGAGMLAVYAWYRDLNLALAAMATICMAVTVFYDWRVMQQTEKLTGALSGEDIRAVWELLKGKCPLMISQLIPFAIVAFPRQTIAALMGNEQLGIFASLFTPTVVITTLMPALILAVVPQMAQAYWKDDKQRFPGLLAKCYGSIILVTLLAELAAVTVGRLFIALLFGREILGYYALLYWSILISGLNAATQCGEQALVIMHRVKAPMVITATAFAVLVVIARPLVAGLGLMGATVSLLTVYGMIVLMQLALSARTLTEKENKNGAQHMPDERTPRS